MNERKEKIIFTAPAEHQHSQSAPIHNAIAFAMIEGSQKKKYFNCFKLDFGGLANNDTIVICMEICFGGIFK